MEKIRKNLEQETLYIDLETTRVYLKKTAEGYEMGTTDGARGNRIVFDDLGEALLALLGMIGFWEPGLGGK